MFKHYVVSVWRNFLRHKISTSISVLGLSLGVACFVVAIGASTYLNSSDRHLENSNRVVMILERRISTEAPINTGFIPHTSDGLAQAMRTEFPDLAAVAHIDGYGVWPDYVDGRKVIVDHSVVDADYLRVLSLPRLQSSASNPLAVPLSVVLSEETARQLFGDINVVGRTFKLRNLLNVTVSAVLKSLPQPSHIGNTSHSLYDIGVLMTADTMRALQVAATGKEPRNRSLSAQWDLNAGCYTYALLPEDNSWTPHMLQTRMQGLAERHGAGTEWAHEFRVTTLSRSMLVVSEMLYLPFESDISIPSTPLLLALLVLVVACANYVNLAFAQAMQRAKETGVRRTIGATRLQVITSAFVESGCHVLVAAILAAGLVAIAVATIESRMGFQVVRAITQEFRFWSSVASLVFAVCIVICLYPAFAQSRIKPSSIMRASANGSGKGAGARMLFGLQFAITGALLAIVMNVHAQNTLARQAALTPSADPTVVLGSNWRFSNVPFDTWRNELLRSSAIKVVSATGNRPWTSDFGFFSFVVGGHNGAINPVAAAVQYDFEKALGLEVIAGRSFDRSLSDVEIFAQGEPAVLVDETLARLIGFTNPRDAVNQVIPRKDGNGPVRIIGVIKDQPLRLLPFMDRSGNAYVLFKAAAGYPVVRIDRTRLEEGLAAVDATWKKLNPTEPVERHFIDESFDRAYAVYAVIGKLVTVISGVALLVAILGGFGFASFIASRRAHEIGVRKTLGARTGQIIAMLLNDFSRPVLIASIAICPLSYLAIQQYLTLFIERIDVTLFSFVPTLILTLLISWFAVGGQAWRAASLKPADVLRHE